jgi:cold shock CspA family protein
MGNQREIEGVVVYMHRCDKPWGKIEPANGDPDVWFGTYAANGETFQKGDLVSFVYSNNFKGGKPSAFRVYLKERAGEFET